MGSGEEFANGRGCFRFVAVPALLLAALLAPIARITGRRRKDRSV
jgi:hypothetical protein